MEFRNLKTFIMVAEIKSFSKTAEILGYSQSNVSLQIQQLENELEVKLFERIGRNIKLTEAGKNLLFYANEIKTINKLAINEIKKLTPENKELRGALKIGSIESISTAILPDLIAKFHQKYQNIKLKVITENSNILSDKIKNNEIDLFF